ncbi:MAG: efflux RND transporter periplasmic adaptor subunit, partial [Bradymonadaceae bacterium]
MKLIRETRHRRWTAGGLLAALLAVGGGLSGCDVDDARAGGGHAHGGAGGHGSGGHGGEEQIGQEDGHGHGSMAHSEVVYQGGYELFVEYPELVTGKKATFAAHISTVDGYEPADRGSVAVVLTSDGAPGERFEANEPVRGGLYQPVAQPEHAGTRQLFVVYSGEGGTAHFSLGEVEVYDSPPEAGHAHKDGHGHGGGGGGISFSKEQQWKVDFATGTVETQTLQESVPAQGIVRTAPDATARLRAPFAGRLLEPSGGIPDIGEQVEAGQPLAVIAPTVDANALPMLRADLSKAKTKLKRRRREVERLKGLVEQGAIPRKRLLDAKSDVQSAKADVEAARQRIDQYQSFDSGGRGAAVTLRAPTAGKVDERPVTSGEYVESGDVILRTTDETRLRLEVRIAEANAPTIDHIGGVWFQSGDGGTVESTRSKDRFFARLARIDPET